MKDKILIAIVILNTILAYKVYGQECWDTTKAEYINFKWYKIARGDANGIDTNTSKDIFIYPVSRTEYACEEVK